ncbi:MAG: 4-alpha-glucanotransferase, partial [Actinomycetota bacterium]|nr:4-alpha-glucanotransferase [Actinomycetota bacterium]
ALGLSPLHAATPLPPLPASPYSPSSRRWHNPTLLCVEAIPCAAELRDLPRHAEAARALLAEPLVDRDAAWAAKSAVLEAIWEQRSDRVRDEVAAFEATEGRPLELWTTFCTLAELHGPDWWRWPEHLRHPDRPEVAAAVEAHRDRLAFHAWLQLHLGQQLDDAAGLGVRLIQDLAIGVDPHGADAWALQDLLALGVSVGAPPDDFGPQGQVWGLPPFIPWRLRDAGYRPLAELLRAGMRGGGGLRIDHVMGLSRLFWVPEGTDPAEASYVRFAGRELLEVLAMESARSGAIVVGEDLGTVEDHLRTELADTGVLSTRLVWFEDDPPEHYPAQSLGMVTTHDLPTLAGLWTGADDDELEAIGRPAPPDATAGVLDRVARLTGLDPRVRSADDLPAALESLHHRLGAGSSVLVLATLEDATATVPRPNVPGTTSERPNWSLALATPVDELDQSPTVPLVVDALREGRGQASQGD